MLGSSQTTRRARPRSATPIRIAALVIALVSLVLLAAWIDGGEEPLRAISVPVMDMPR
ncbi:MAG: hypothetical protein WA954_01395 [Parerythrobacter sp.]